MTLHEGCPETLGAASIDSRSALMVGAQANLGLVPSARVTMTGMDEGSDWTVDYFDDPYTELHPFPDAAQTDAEIEALTTLLPAIPARILDVACGQGRYAVTLAERGFRVVGIDTSATFLATARAAAVPGSEIDLIQGDMRDLSFTDEFDAALSLFTSWGYFDDHQNQQVLDRIARALRPRGRLVLELMHRDALTRIFTPKDWIELRDGTFVVVDRAFDPVAGITVVSNRWRTPTGEQRERQHRIRVYTATELDHMLRHAGLAPVGWYAGFSLQPLSFHSRRLLVVADRSS